MDLLEKFLGMKNLVNQLGKSPLLYASSCRTQFFAIESVCDLKERLLSSEMPKVEVEQSQLMYLSDCHRRRKLSHQTLI
jgi:hypothetical protein